MERFVNHIYRALLRYNEAIEFVEKEDVKQEIRFAILTAKPGFVYRVASKLVYNLIRDYGFSRKMGKDQFDAFYQSLELTDEQKKIIQEIENSILLKIIAQKKLQ
jgi:radical SAM superfamily enzyme YgiQ (UPF0313 family)